MRRTLVALGLSATLALAGCGLNAGSRTAAGSSDTAASDTAASDSAVSDAATTDVVDAAVALQQVGFETGLDGTASAGTGDAPHRAIRKYLRRNTLHGEVAIQTKNNGTKTVVVQRGSITAVTATGVSVKSSDGFALTWTFGDKLRVVQDRRTVESSALKTGAEIGIAGVKDGDASVARLIAIK